MARFANDALAAAVTAMVIALAPPQAAHAAEPPWPGCRPASKIEYRSAKEQYLLVGRFGVYVRTGGIWRRSYWYCPR
jgi:hypothetical protein